MNASTWTLLGHAIWFGLGLVVICVGRWYHTHPAPRPGTPWEESAKRRRIDDIVEHDEIPPW